MTDNIQKLYEIAGVDSIGFDTYTLKDEYPPFTAEKQLELIKWLAKNYESYHLFYGEEFKWNSQVDWYSSFCYDDFSESLANLIKTIWQDLTDDQKQEIKEILE